MSGFATAFSGAGYVRSIISSIVAKPTRQIVWPVPSSTMVQGPDGAPTITTNPIGRQQGISGYVALVEEHHDEMIITDHPVEQGSVISDHAFKLPSLLHMDLGYTTSSALASGLPTIAGIIPIPTLAGFFPQGNSSFLQQVYQRFLALQATRTLLQIYTGKRTYDNMLIQGLTIRTDEALENAMIIQGQFRQLFIARTTVVQAPINSAAQAQPQATTPVQQTGQQQVQPGDKFNPQDATLEA